MDDYGNFSYSTVLTAPSPASSGTSVVVHPGDGTVFPTPPFNVVIWPVGTQPISTNAEIVRVTAVSTDTFTIVRTQESTSARTVLVGDQIAAVITNKTLRDLDGQLVTTEDCYLAVGTGMMILSDYEIGATFVTEIASTALLEIS